MGIFKSKPPVVRPRVSPSVKMPTKDVIGLARRMDRNPKQAQRYAYKTLTKQGVVAKTPAQQKAKLQRAKGVAFRQHLQAKRATTRSITRTKKNLAAIAQKQKQEAATKKAAKIGFAARLGLGAYRTLVRGPLSRMATAGRWPPG